MSRTRNEQKLISFINTPTEFAKIAEEMQKGWNIISLIKNGDYFLGIMEFDSEDSTVTQTVYIPPRKRIKISQH